MQFPNDMALFVKIAKIQEFSRCCHCPLLCHFTE